MRCPLNTEQKAAPNVRICDSQGIEQVAEGVFVIEED